MIPVAIVNTTIDCILLLSKNHSANMFFLYKNFLHTVYVRLVNCTVKKHTCHKNNEMLISLGNI
jgi:hypothetical protein